MRNCCIRPRPEFTFLEEKLHGPMTPISDLTAFKRCLFGIAGHATVARQRDHLFRPQSCWLLQYYYIRVATPYKHRDLNFFRYFSCPWSSITLSRCRCHKAKKLSRAQLCTLDTDITCKEEEELHLGQCLAQTLPPPTGEGNEMVVFAYASCRVQKPLRPEPVPVHPVVALKVRNGSLFHSYKQSVYPDNVPTIFPDEPKPIAD